MVKSDGAVQWRLARCCPTWRTMLLFLLVAVPLWRPAAAAVLEAPAGQVLEPGQHLQLPLDIRQGQGPRLEIRLGVAPPGASLVLEDDGQLLLDWLTGPDLPEETQIELLLRDVDTGEPLDSVFVVIRQPGAAQPDAAQPDAAQPPVEKPVEIPEFAALANQVVSAGRTVTLRVSASLSGDVSPVLQVDRLPRRASFEANDDGSRTFRWQTQGDDQGEHLFRFTAFNPRAPQHRTRQEILIVVGDPTLNITLPEPLPEPLPEQVPGQDR